MTSACKRPRDGRMAESFLNKDVCCDEDFEELFTLECGLGKRRGVDKMTSDEMKKEAQSHIYNYKKSNGVELDKHQSLACSKVFKNDLTMINAGPGTGKTTTVCKLLQSIMLDSGHDPPMVVALTFTRAGEQVLIKNMEKLLPDHLIKSMFSFPSDKGLYIATFDKFAGNIIGALDIGNVGYDGRKLIAGKHISEDEDLKLDFLVVDESQDVKVPEMAIITSLAEKTKRTVLAGDPRQECSQGNMFFSSKWMYTEEEEGKVAKCNLVNNYRSSPGIVCRINQFSAENFPNIGGKCPQYAAAAKYHDLEERDFPSVVIHDCLGSSDMGVKIAEVLIKYSPDDAYVIAPATFRKMGCAMTWNKLESCMKAQNCRMSTEITTNERKTSCEKECQDSYMIGTSQKLKGTERNYVLIYGVDLDYKNQFFKPNRLKKLLYVALSRAKLQVHIFMNTKGRTTDSMRNLEGSFITKRGRFTKNLAEESLQIIEKTSQDYRRIANNHQGPRVIMKSGCSGVATKDFDTVTKHVYSLDNMFEVPTFSDEKMERYLTSLVNIISGIEYRTTRIVVTSSSKVPPNKRYVMRKLHNSGKFELMCPKEIAEKVQKFLCEGDQKYHKEILGAFGAENLAHINSADSIITLRNDINVLNLKTADLDKLKEITSFTKDSLLFMRKLVSKELFLTKSQKDRKLSIWTSEEERYHEQLFWDELDEDWLQETSVTTKNTEHLGTSAVPSCLSFRSQLEKIDSSPYVTCKFNFSISCQGYDIPVMIINSSDGPSDSDSRICACVARMAGCPFGLIWASGPADVLFIEAINPLVLNSMVRAIFFTEMTENIVRARYIPPPYLVGAWKVFYLEINEIGDEQQDEVKFASQIALLCTEQTGKVLDAQMLCIKEPIQGNVKRKWKYEIYSWIKRACRGLISPVITTNVEASNRFLTALRDNAESYDTYDHPTLEPHDLWYPIKGIMGDDIVDFRDQLEKVEKDNKLNFAISHMICPPMAKDMIMNDPMDRCIASCCFTNALFNWDGDV